MIPKTIHYCWFGHNPKPKIVNECINTWKEKCPDYEIVEWNENNFDINMAIYVKEAYECKKWAFVSDYARLWIIYNYGGIYLDTDVKLLKNLDEVINSDLFITSEDNHYIATGLGFGATKNNKIVKELLDDYKDVHFIQNGIIDYTTCPIRNTKVLDKYLKNNDLNEKFTNDYFTYYSKEYFNPRNEITYKIEPTEKTIGIHLGMASWMKKRTKFIYNVKNFSKKIIGEKSTRVIKKILKK